MSFIHVLFCRFQFLDDTILLSVMILHLKPQVIFSLRKLHDAIYEENYMMLQVEGISPVHKF